MTDPQAWNDGHDTGFRSGHQAGYRAGYDAGYAAGLAVLDDAARALAALQPSRGIDTATARATAAARPTRGPDFTDPDAVAAYRARIHASWGLPATQVDERVGERGDEHDTHPGNGFDAYASTSEGADHA